MCYKSAGEGGGLVAAALRQFEVSSASHMKQTYLDCKSRATRQGSAVKHNFVCVKVLRTRLASSRHGPRQRSLLVVVEVVDRNNSEQYAVYAQRCK